MTARCRFCDDLMKASPGLRVWSAVGVNDLKNRQHKWTKRGWLYAACAALLVQSLFPGGYMPANLQSGWVAMLCPDGLPSAFVEQLQSGVDDPHAHHHGHSEASNAHGDTGDCQLGSGLDQPIDIATAATAALAALDGALQAPPVATLLTDRRLLRVRSRAPPIS